MPSPKNGTAGFIVSPADPGAAQDAVDAQAGEVTAAQATPGQEPPPWNSQDLSPYKPPEQQTEEEKEEKTDWIEIELVDETGQPVAGESYEIITADELVASGTLDDKGCARLEGIQPGNCKISFPNLDKDAWEAK
jgi:hypothetical protein